MVSIRWRVASHRPVAFMAFRCSIRWRSRSHVLCFRDDPKRQINEMDYFFTFKGAVLTLNLMESGLLKPAEIN